MQLHHLTSADSTGSGADRAERCSCRALLQVTDSTLMALAEGANCDIRLVLGQLQMVRLRACALSYDRVKVGASRLLALVAALLASVLPSCASSAGAARQ